MVVFGRGLLFSPELGRFRGFGGYFFNDFVQTCIVHSVDD